MAVEVEMPQLSDTMEKGTIVRWLKEEGDAVERGDVLAEVETDKATMDLEAFDEGILLKRLYDEGEDAPTQTLVAVIGEEGEDISDIIESSGDEQTDKQDEPQEATGDEESDDSEEQESEEEPDDQPSEPSFEETPESDQLDDEPDAEPTAKSDNQSATKDMEPSTVDASQEDGKLRVSPVARRIAAENRIDLFQLDGSGPEGRIIKKDVERAIEEGQARLAQVETADEVTEPSPLESEKMELSGMRKTIAERMAQSKRQAPHFYLTREINMERVTDLRDEFNSSESDDLELSYNDFVLMASARALCEVPEVNSSFQEEYIELYDHVDLGFAVAVEEGLFTPVIPNAERKSILEIKQESQQLIEKARDGTLEPDDYKGGTFTISNLGMFDISNFTAVINPPQAAIMAVGAVEDKPVVEDGDLSVGRRMEVTLSCDHRAIDGVHGSRYLQELADLLEHPVRLIA